jgi:hypothetical protein
MREATLGEGVEEVRGKRGTLVKVGEICQGRLRELGNDRKVERWGRMEGKV